MIGEEGTIKVFINNKKNLDFGFASKETEVNVNVPTVKQDKVSAFILKL